MMMMSKRKKMGLYELSKSHSMLSKVGAGRQERNWEIENDENSKYSSGLVKVAEVALGLPAVAVLEWKVTTDLKYNICKLLLL